MLVHEMEVLCKLHQGRGTLASLLVSFTSHKVSAQGFLSVNKCFLLKGQISQQAPSEEGSEHPKALKSKPVSEEMEKWLLLPLPSPHHPCCLQEERLLQTPEPLKPCERVSPVWSLSLHVIFVALCTFSVF